MRCSLTAWLDVTEAAVPAAIRELEVFAAMNRGPGIVDWPDVDPRGRVEITAALLLGRNGGCASYERARKEAARFHDRLAEMVEERRRAAELGDRRALDLAALVPVPRAVLLLGYGGGGREWLLANWGVEVPVSFAQGMEVKCSPAPRKGGRPRKGSLPLVRVAKEWTFSVEPGFPEAWLMQVRRLYPRLGFTAEADGEAVVHVPEAAGRVAA
ncbi:MAG TPA: hypothetical protein PKV67_13365 [Hyphomonas sp.]|nr:hypothetical protein [Hyphomonas sp.]HRJ01748.1 hypothetical protein [Hyphomonas sp.]